MFEIIFFIFVSIYFLETVIFVIGIRKEFQKIADDQLPSISIIVAARDEEDNIFDCLLSLDKLIYPKEQIEIIIVNDNSTDRTGEIVENFIKTKPKFKLIKPSKQYGDVKGKANAIANGIEIAKGEIIFTTDADCIVSPTWAKTLASYYKPDVAMVCGYTNQTSQTNFKAMQSLDFIYLLGVAAGAMNLGKPLSCIGNNMSYRKSVYEEIGGYANIPFSVTEDFKLLMAFHKLKKYKIIYPLDADGLVTSKACPDLKTLYWQKKRWGVGGLDSDVVGFGVMAPAFIIHLMIFLAPFFYSATLLYLLLFKFFIDYFFLLPLCQHLKQKMKLTQFVFFEIYFLIYVVLLPFIVLFKKKVKWKGRSF